MLSLSKRQLALTVLLSALLAGVAHLITTPESRPVLVDAYQPQRLSVEPAVQDLGVIEMEQPAQTVFRLLNQGGRPLTIQKVESSCGCTTTQLDKTRLSAGRSTRLQVAIDTRIKLGPITKTIDIYSNDPVHPHQVLTVKAHVVAPPGRVHNGQITVRNPLVLFQGTCKTCHVDKGVGKTGQALFIADCGMCHGMSAQGGVAPSLLVGNYDDSQYVAQVRQIIAQGAINNPSMPPFSRAKGGPLSDSQIESLIRYLRYESQQLKTKAPGKATEVPAS